MPTTPPLGAVALVGEDGKPLPLPRHRLIDGRVTIGRDPGNDLPVNDRFVSRHHLTVMRAGEHWYVLDRGASNGTWLRGERVVGGAELRDGDEIQFGRCRLMCNLPAAVAEPRLEISPPIDPAPIGQGFVDALEGRRAPTTPREWLRQYCEYYRPHLELWRALLLVSTGSVLVPHAGWHWSLEGAPTLPLSTLQSLEHRGMLPMVSHQPSPVAVPGASKHSAVQVLCALHSTAIVRPATYRTAALDAADAALWLECSPLAHAGLSAACAVAQRTFRLA